MEHLSAETLARLVDEEPRPDEADHLATCRRCTRELIAIRELTEALGGLPEIMPPKGDWKVLEARLRSEGLLESPGLFQTLGLAQTPSWMRAAAAVLLFLAGVGSGAALTSPGGSDLVGPAVADAATVEQAASAMRLAEEGYVAAFARYREILARDGGETLVGDPMSRYAALEHLVSVSQAAVRQAPADPFLNGVLASALAERDAMVRLVSARGNNWF
jgi:hypothetical protein